MPTLVNGEMTFTPEEAIAPAILKGYGGGDIRRNGDKIIIHFDTHHGAAAWATTTGMDKIAYLYMGKGSGCIAGPCSVELYPEELDA